MEPVNSCTDCGLVFDSSKSLDVHLSYHKENLLSKWGSSATGGGAGTGSEANNNVNVKKEKVQPDSSDFLFDFQQQQEYRHQQLQHQHQQQQHQQQHQQQQMISRGYRFHPYGYERQVSSSQVNCEKCGLSMDASQLAEHNAQMHPWEEPQAEILDLDSHKVHVYQPPEETPPWRYFKEENGNTSPELGGVSTTTNSGGGNDLYSYEPSPQQKFLPKAAAWKSNEARRPKTYNCSACNKWFTSSGHLKRHYNTTLHKNAVKQSGGLDPASMPVASHHHPPQQPPQQQQQPQQQQHQEETTSSTTTWHQPQSVGGPNSGGQQSAPAALYAHHPPPDVAPPPSAYFLSGYHHPNGEPPRRMLPSFSQLTGVSYDRDMAGGLEDHREAVLEMHHQVQPPLQPQQQDLTSISKHLLSTQVSYI